MAAPNIPDINTLIAAGFDPKTGLPRKFEGVTTNNLDSDVLKVLRIIDEQDALGRYQWYNLPDGLDSDLLERILYYRYKGIFFYLESLDQFFFLPFALDGGIDVYGRYNGCRPMPFHGSTDADSKGKKTQRDYISEFKYKPVYSIKDSDELTWEDITTSCVVLEDYCKQISQTGIPRQELNDPILKLESQCLPLMRTALIANSGVKGVRVNTSDEETNVEYLGRSIEDAALKGKIYVPTVGSMEFQELTGATASSRAEEFLMAMQSIENFRLGLYGIESGGVFEKKAHTLESEQAMNQAPVSIAYQDGLSRRQKFCDIVNSIWGLGIWVEPSEAVLGVDNNGDGVVYDIDQAPVEIGGNESNDGNTKM